MGGLTRKDRLKRGAAISLVAALCVLLLGWATSSVWHGGDGGAGRDRSAGAGGPSSPTVPNASPAAPTAGARRYRPVEISPALLSEYYEHGPEHAPPRDPSGAMQRRERDYTPQPNPFALLRRKLATGDADAGVRAWLAAHEAELTSPQSASPEPDAAGVRAAGRVRQQADRALADTLVRSSLDAETLLDTGRAFQFLDGEALAATWYLAGFTKAEEQFKATRPGDPSARRVLALAEQTGKALWRANIWDVQEKRFRLARRLYPPLSAEARRSGVLLGVSLFYQGKYKEAADVILAVQAEHDQAGDLGARERSDLDEMAWLQGLFLQSAGRSDEALPHFKRCAELGMHWSSQAQMMVRRIEAQQARARPATRPATGG